MSAKKATLTTVAAFFVFVLAVVGIGSLSANGNDSIPADGYGISKNLNGLK